MPIEEVASGAEPAEIEEFVRGGIRSYRRTLSADRRQLLERFRYVHAARKVVGVGSVGTRAWIVLMLGRDENDPLFLQLKEAQPSVLEPFLGTSAFAKHGQRVVEGQRLTQAASDIMLGWMRITAYDGATRDFYVRQLWDGKGSALVEAMNPAAMSMYAGLCGHALAKAHARSGDAIAIASYLGAGDSFDRALASFAEAYADQNERDYHALRRGRCVWPRRGRSRRLGSDETIGPLGLESAPAPLPRPGARGAGLARLGPTDGPDPPGSRWWCVSGGMGAAGFEPATSRV